MSDSPIVAWLVSTLDMWMHTFMWLGVLGVLFYGLSKFFPCNANQRYWKKESVITDLMYWLVVPLLTRVIKILLLVQATRWILGLDTDEEITAYLENGYGMLATLPVWGQALLLLIFSDFLLYWIHRGFHGKSMWKYHAIHHSSKDVEWISANRFHPINSWLAFTVVDILMLLIGFSPAAFILLAPFNVVYSAMVHANLNWTFGPFKKVLVSPVYHRWHHTLTHEGGNKNFAPTFPILDLMFGTYYMPEGRLPEVYGVDDDSLTESFWQQMIYPFTRR